MSSPGHAGAVLIKPALERLISENRNCSAKQTAHLERVYGLGPSAISARRLIAILRLDLETYRHSRDAIVEAERIITLSRQIDS